MNLNSGIVADIGGTHARFAMAARDSAGDIRLSHVDTLRTADFPTFEAAYKSYVSESGYAPQNAVFAVASPIIDDEVKLTNSPWSMRPSTLAQRLAVSHALVINDFAAIAHSIPYLPSSSIRDLSHGPFTLPAAGIVSIVGPGSGLGVGMLARGLDGDHVFPAEGGHIGFAPTDEIDSFILRFALQRYPRVSAERLISGPGLALIYEALAALENRAIAPQQTISLWNAAITQSDPHAVTAYERWLMMLGAFAGDIALAHGAKAVVLAGGILPRFEDRLNTRALLERFYAKGRFESAMRAVPIALINHREPGLIGAASLLGR